MASKDLSFYTVLPPARGIRRMAAGQPLHKIGRAAPGLVQTTPGGWALIPGVSVDLLEAGVAQVTLGPPIGSEPRSTKE